MRAWTVVSVMLMAWACKGGDKDPAADDTDTTADDTDTTADDTDETDDAAASDEYFTGVMSAGLGGGGNQASCATCHSATTTSNGDPGDPLGDIFYRTSFKGGDAATLLDATNACVAGWMGGTALTETDASWLSLSAYLESISDSSVTTPNAMSPEILANEAAYDAAYGTGGDFTAGQTGFARSCARCHTGARNVGGSEAPDSATYAPNGAGYIAQKVRTSGPPPSGTEDASDFTPGPMPFFEPSDLSVQELKDIIMFIVTPPT